MTPPPAGKENGDALRLLILGGTTEASALVRALAGRRDIAPLLSFAGRTGTPATPPVPHRIGGFGGIEGLEAFLRTQSIDAVVDATHPFAARISASASAACVSLGVPLVAFTRSAWEPGPGDRWTDVPDIAAAVAALGSFGSDLSVFLTIGRLELARFRAAPPHRYLVRTIDAPDAADLPQRTQVVLARPPFRIADEIALLRAHGVDLLVTKNSGGVASAAKLAAARALNVPVLMVQRPAPSGADELRKLDDVLAWITARQRSA